MIDPLFRFLPCDHASLGQRLREAREATMGLLLVAPPNSKVSRIARETIAAVDRLRSEMDCHLQVTRPLRRDPRRMTRHIYGGLTHLAGCLASEAERDNDHFAGWELED